MPPSVANRKPSALVVSSPASQRPSIGMPIQSTALPSTIVTARSAVPMPLRSLRRSICANTVATQYHSVLVHCVAAMAGKLEVRVDRESGTPLGRQLAEGIRAAVAGGAPAPGDRLPSVRELAEAAGVNVNTVRAVYARLEAEGLVRSEHGRGTFVEGVKAPTPSRRALREQIAALEATLARLPPPPLAEEE